MMRSLIIFVMLPYVIQCSKIVYSPLNPVVYGNGYNRSNTQFYYHGCLSSGYGGGPVVPEASGYDLSCYFGDAYRPQPSYENMIYPGTAALSRSSNLPYLEDDLYYLPSAYPDSYENYECAEPTSSSETAIVDSVDRANLKIYDEVTQTWRSDGDNRPRSDEAAASKKPDTEIKMIDEFLVSLRNKKTKDEALARAGKGGPSIRRKSRDDSISAKHPLSGDASSRTKEIDMIDEFLESLKNKRTRANAFVRAKDDDPTKRQKRRDDVLDSRRRRSGDSSKKPKSSHSTKDIEKVDELPVPVPKKRTETDDNRTALPKRREDASPEATETRKKSPTPIPRKHHRRESRSRHREDDFRRRREKERSKSRSSAAEHRPDDRDRKKRSKSRSDLAEPRPDRDREKRSKSRSDLVEPRRDRDQEKHSKSRSNLVEPRPDRDREKRSKSRSSLTEPRPDHDWVEKPRYHSYRDDRSTRNDGGGKKRLKSLINSQPVRTQKPVVKDLAALIASRRATLVSDRLMEEQKRVAGEKLRKLAFRPHRLLGFDSLVTEEEADDCVLKEPEIPVVDLSDYESTEETTSHEVGKNLLPLSAIKIEYESSDDESGGQKDQNPKVGDSEVINSTNNVERLAPSTIPTSCNEDCSRPEDDASRSIVEETGTSQQECSLVIDVDNQPTEECVQEIVDDQPTEECVQETVGSDQHTEERIQEAVNVQITEQCVQETLGSDQHVEECVPENARVQRREECVPEAEIPVTENNASKSQLEKEPGEIDDDDIISLLTYDDLTEGSDNELSPTSNELLWKDLECKLENENRNYLAAEGGRRSRSPLYSSINSNSDSSSTPTKEVDLGEHLPGRYRYTRNSKGMERSLSNKKEDDRKRNGKQKKRKKKRKRSPSCTSGLILKKCRNRAAENSRHKSPIAKEPRDSTSLENDNLAHLEAERKRLLQLVEEPPRRDSTSTEVENSIHLVNLRKKLSQEKDEAAEEQRGWSPSDIENLILLVEERKRLLLKKNKLVEKHRIPPSSEIKNLLRLVEERKRLLWEKNELVQVSNEVRKEANDQMINDVINIEDDEIEDDEIEDDEIEEPKIASPKHVSIPGFCTCATEEMSEVEACLYRQMKRFEDELKTASLHYVAKSLQSKIDEIKNELANAHICDVRANNFDIAKCHCTASRLNATSYCICEKEELERLKYRLQLLLEISDDGQRREWLQNMMKDTEHRLLKYL